jgi:L-ascorbate metabolism protein UlaG (beta-lactamase superfamily)
MEITWYGHSCFRITDRGGTTVVCDPFNSSAVGYEPLKLKADIVTVSHNTPSHNFVQGIKGEPYIIYGPGEYEIGGVFISGLQTTRKNKKSETPIVNTMYVIEYDGINIFHAGDMQQTPTQREVESLGPVHIALVPVGGAGTLNAAKASDVISLFEPNIVIPMHYQTPDSKIELDPIAKFLKEMGLSHIETQASYKVSSASTLPEETQVVVLDYPHA